MSTPSCRTALFRPSVRSPPTSSTVRYLLRVAFCAQVSVDGARVGVGDKGDIFISAVFCVLCHVLVRTRYSASVGFDYEACFICICFWWPCQCIPKQRRRWLRPLSCRDRRDRDNLFHLDEIDATVVEFEGGGREGEGGGSATRDG